MTFHFYLEYVMVMVARRGVDNSSSRIKKRGKPGTRVA